MPRLRLDRMMYSPSGAGRTEMGQTGRGAREKSGAASAAICGGGGKLDITRPVMVSTLHALF